MQSVAKVFVTIIKDVFVNNFSYLTASVLDVVGEVGRKDLLGVRALERRVIFVFEGLMCFIDVTKLGPSPARCLLWLKINEIDIT